VKITVHPTASSFGSQGRPPAVHEDSSEGFNLAAVLAEPAPCDGCPWRRACAEDELACHIFARWVDGRWHSWPTSADRKPNKRLFKRIFSSSFFVYGKQDLPGPKDLK
jgi:hypothetical protein